MNVCQHPAIMVEAKFCSAAVGCGYGLTPCDCNQIRARLAQRGDVSAGILYYVFLTLTSQPNITQHVIVDTKEMKDAAEKADGLQLIPGFQRSFITSLRWNEYLPYVR